MPITSASPLVWTIQAMQIDMVAGVCNVTMNAVCGAVQMGATNFTIPQADFLALITTPPTQGLTRQDDLVAAIYHYAVTHGYANGTVS
jgi:hypothetical protein